jgi:hypothetical protein
MSQLTQICWKGAVMRIHAVLRRCFAITMTAAALWSATVHAAIVTMSFDTVAKGTASGSSPWLGLTIEDTGIAGTVRLTVNASLDTAGSPRKLSQVSGSTFQA